MSYKVGDKDTRPWGEWEVLAYGEVEGVVKFCVKRITVRPGQKLSKQLHKFRTEHWFFLIGAGLITLGMKGNQYHKVEGVSAGESVDIPAETEHRIENIGKGKLTFIEIQTGSRLEEDDIVRIEDVYGRI